MSIFTTLGDKTSSLTMTQMSAPCTLHDLAFPYLISLEQNDKVNILKKTNYTELSMLFAVALNHEAYELCAEIKTILTEREEQLPCY